MKKNSDTSAEAHASREAELVAVEDRGDKPIDVTKPAAVEPNPKAVEKYGALGQADATNHGVDVYSGPDSPAAPSAGIVKTLSRSPLDALGQRFEQVRAAYAAGSYGKSAPSEVSRAKLVGSLWPIIVVIVAVAIAGIISEIVYGQHAAALLTGAAPDQALKAAIAFTLVFNGAALFAAHMAYDAYPAIVRQRGVRMLIGILLLIAVVAAGLGLVVGGYDPIHIQTVDGGAAASNAVPEPDTRPLLSMTYFGIIVLITVAIAAGHLLQLHLIDVKFVAKTKTAIAEAADKSLDWGSARALAIAVAQSYLDAIEAAHQQGRHRVGARNAAFRRNCSPEIGDMFDDVMYDDSEPSWAAEVESFITELDEQEPPAANLSLIA